MTFHNISAELKINRLMVQGKGNLQKLRKEKNQENWVAVVSMVSVPMVPPALGDPLPYLVNELKEGNRSLPLRPIRELNSVKGEPLPGRGSCVAREKSTGKISAQVRDKEVRV